MKLILLPSAQEPDSTCRVSPRICGFDCQLSRRQPEDFGWIYRAFRSPSLGSTLSGCQLYGRLLEILAHLLVPELWPSGSPDLLAPHQIICTESLIQRQGLWVLLSKPTQNLQCRIYSILYMRINMPQLYIGLLQVSTTSLSSYTKNMFVYFIFPSENIDVALPIYLLSVQQILVFHAGAFAKRDHYRYCSFKVDTWTLKLPFFFFSCCRWKMTLLLDILMQSYCSDIFWRNLSPPRAQCQLLVSSINPEISLLKVKKPVLRRVH